MHVATDTLHQRGGETPLIAKRDSA